MLIKVLEFAIKKHQNQFRKGSKIPYITHPIESMNILLANGFDETIQIAALLHDTIEDTETTYEEIRNLFGSEVADVVQMNTEDKTRSWEERKKHTIDQLRDEFEIQWTAVCFADKLANLRSIFRDIETNGFDIWDKFNADVEDILNYYKNIFIYSHPFKNKPMYHEYDKIYKIISSKGKQNIVLK